MEPEPQVGQDSGRERTDPKRISEGKQKGWVLHTDIPGNVTFKKPVHMLTLSERRDVFP